MPHNQELLNDFLLGMIVMASAAAGLFFLRFWRKTRNRLFAMFAIAFWVLGVNWLALAFISRDEIRTWLYAFRLAAFILILAAIIDKNRPRGAG